MQSWMTSLRYYGWKIVPIYAQEKAGAGCTSCLGADMVQRHRGDYTSSPRQQARACAASLPQATLYAALQTALGVIATEKRRRRSLGDYCLLRLAIWACVCAIRRSAAGCTASSRYAGNNR